MILCPEVEKAYADARTRIAALDHEFEHVRTVVNALARFDGPVPEINQPPEIKSEEENRALEPVFAKAQEALKRFSKAESAIIGAEKRLAEAKRALAQAEAEAMAAEIAEQARRKAASDRRTARIVLLVAVLAGLAVTILRTGLL